MKKQNKIRFLTQAAVIAAMYVILTLLTNAFGLANGVIQIRISEALTVLPCVISAAVPGLTLGCLLSNIMTGCIAIDIVCGTIATLIGAIATKALCRYKLLAPIPPILSNTLIIPFVLSYAYHIPGSIPYFMLTVGTGEIISCGILGYMLLFALKRVTKSYR